MKNFNIIKKFTKVVFGLLALVSVSCEDIIDLTPYNNVSETSAFSTPSLIALSVTGVYNAAQLGYYDGNYRGYPFGAAFVEQGDCRGEDAVNVGTFYQLTYTATYSTTTANNVWMWSDSYRLINRCNIIIEGVKKAGETGVITSAKALEYEAEARFSGRLPIMNYSFILPALINILQMHRTRAFLTMKLLLQQQEQLNKV